MVCSTAYDHVQGHVEITSGRRQTKVSYQRMGRRHRICCGGCNAHPLAHHGGLHDSNSIHGELSACWGFPLRKQVPLRNAHAEDTHSDAADTPEDMVHRSSFVCGLGPAATIPPARYFSCEA